MQLRSLLIVLTILLNPTLLLAKQGCGNEGVWLQVLGSGGPEIGDKRASSSYIIWQDGKARVLVDIGPGSMLRFEESGAQLNDVKYILLSHLHVDHSADLPAFIKASFFTDRSLDLPLYGPTGNKRMPATTDYVQSLLGTSGAFKYLSSYLDGSDSYQLKPHNIDASKKTIHVVKDDGELQIKTIAVHHGPIPALAWRVETGGKTLVFSGDMNGEYNTLPELARGADLLLAHHAIPQHAKGVARNLHMPPSVIGEIAAKAQVKQLVLSHHMLRTLNTEPASTKQIREHYRGPLKFADDLQCFKP